MDARRVMDRLVDVQMLRTPEEVEEFERLLLELGRNHDLPDAPNLVDLFHIFADQTEQPEVMWGLVHYLESWDTSIYVHGFLRAFTELVSTSPDWANILLLRILNDTPSRSIMHQQKSKLNPDVESVLIDALQSVAAKSLRRKQQVEEVLTGTENLSG